jgi:hypothetical protein
MSLRPWQANVNSWRVPAFQILRRNDQSIEKDSHLLTHVRWKNACSLPMSIIFLAVDGWVHQLRKRFTVSVGSKSCEENKKR